MFKFEIIEKYYNDDFYTIVDENTNFMFKCVNKNPFKIIITTKEDGITINLEGI